MSIPQPTSSKSAPRPVASASAPVPAAFVASAAGPGFFEIVQAVTVERIRVLAIIAEAKVRGDDAGHVTAAIKSGVSAAEFGRDALARQISRNFETANGR